MDDKLYSLVEYILNIAEAPELEVIQAALKKRIADDRKGGPVMGLNPGKLAAESTGRINQQLDASKIMVKKMAIDFASDIIRQNAPELNEAQVQELVSGFMPEMAGGAPAKKKAAASGTRDDASLPSGMIIQMVKQFVDYSEGVMSPGEQVQKIVSLYLNGDIDRQRCDAHLYEILGL